jgi:hypothetical protein
MVAQSKCHPSNGSFTPKNVAMASSLNLPASQDNTALSKLHQSLFSYQDLDMRLMAGESRGVQPSNLQRFCLALCTVRSSMATVH